MEGSMKLQTPQDVQHVIDDLTDSTWAFSAMATASEIGLLEALDPSCTAAQAAAKAAITEDLAKALLDVLTALGLAQREADQYVAAPGLSAFLQASPSQDFLPWLRSSHLQSRQMVDAARNGNLRTGWIHTDPEMLQAQGGTGRIATKGLVTQLFPMLPGLEDRLRSPGASFLDVGSGVGIISIELCRLYPELNVVGLEPAEAPAAEARKNITAAGFGERIEVRSQRVEDLTDREAFDLAYLPQVFMSMDVVKAGLRAIRDALRPGGWILVIAFSAPGDDLHAVTTRLLNVMWGGSPLPAEEFADMTRAAGLEGVQVGGPPGSLMKAIVGRRPL
jgi:2-polyprenyl-3-methyl-5-hydroxy-6-metoxy-1,4-benzoquinol methylase